MILPSPDGCVPARRSRRTLVRLRIVLSCGASILLGGGCVYDADNRCGEHQVLTQSDVEMCVCDATSARTADGCVPCGANEVPGASGCVCAPGFGRIDPSQACLPCGINEVTGLDGCECAKGFARPSGGGACAPLPAGQGVACDPVANPCANAPFDYCAATPGKAGYCTTQGCTSSADCVGGYACELAASPPYCRRPPDGAGKACTSNADCAGTEATYCDTFKTKTCLVEGCTLTPDNCFSGSECCDLTSFGMASLCVAQGACPT